MEKFMMVSAMVLILLSAVAAVAQALGMDASVIKHPLVISAVGLIPTAFIVHWLRHLPNYKPGDHVIYNKYKTSSKPGPRAEQVRRRMLREGYSYNVRKLWTVVDVSEDGNIEVVTRTGKRHEISATDFRLHRPHIWEELYLRLRWHKHFPDVEKAA